MIKKNRSHSEQLYATLLRLYPNAYRQEFGDEMQFVFGELVKDARQQSGDIGLIALWIRTTIDLTKTVPIQHMTHQKGGSMKTKNNSSSLMANRFARVAIGVAAILLIPFASMQLSLGGFDWNAFDFIVAGVLLAGSGLVLDVLLTSKKNSQQLVIGLAILGFIALVWIELAVGLFGTPFAGS